MSTQVEDGELQYTEPAQQIKAFNMETLPQRVFDGMRKYEETARQFSLACFERAKQGDNGPGHAIISHRPADTQTAQLYRISTDPEDTSINRISYFDLGSGRNITSFTPIAGEDWRGVWRDGGVVFAMDLNGNEYFQLWRYWENSNSTAALPRIENELENEPGGRIERLTHDEAKYSNIVVSDSEKIMAFTSNKENGNDMLVYVTNLTNSQTGAAADSQPFTLPSRLVTPLPEKGHSHWIIADISLDDQYILLVDNKSSANLPCYIVPVSGGQPERIVLPNTTEKDSETVYVSPTFSRDPSRPHLLYMITNAWGDFNSVITYDMQTHAVVHITAPEPELRALRPINWSCSHLSVNSECVYFQANVDGYTSLFVLHLSGSLQDTIVEVKPEWEGGEFNFQTNAVNGRPYELILSLLSHVSTRRLARLDLKGRLGDVKKDENGDAYISVPLAPYKQATPILPEYRTFPAKLLRFKSFDGLEIPCMYYHPTGGKSAVPLVISIHGGPAAQSTSNTRGPIHWYIMNELGYAIIYPNVRGSRGYGKRFMAADDVEKREDSVKDIGALLGHVEKSMKDEIDSSRVAVMGGSYGGYMALACLIHFPTQFACGLVNFPVAHWPSFLENTAPSRRDHRRAEYGDERVPEIREFLERISPMTRASEIATPLQIAHGDADSRIPVDQAIRMVKTVLKSGVHAELIVCEKEGHGFKQKSVIEFTNAAKLNFLERFLPPSK